MSRQVPASGAADPESFSREVGRQLRSLRLQRGLTMRAIERRSEGQLKPGMLSSFERGERVLSVNRLAQLARFYDVPVTALLPPHRTAGPLPKMVAAPPALTFDLTRMQRVDSGDMRLVRSFVSDVRRQRRQPCGDELTLRSSDLRTLAIMHRTPPDVLLHRWRQLGILAPHDA